MRKLFTSTLAAVAVATTATASRAAPVTAHSADAVGDSMGVNRHLGYDDRVYNEFSRVKAALREMGVRHHRDGLETPAFKGHIKRRHNELARAGIRGTFLAGLPTEQVLASAELVSDSLEAFEGQNAGASCARSLVLVRADQLNQGDDKGQESNFGLLFKDFSLKPSGQAVKNLIALLGEARYNEAARKREQPDPRFKPGALDFSLSGDTGNVHSTLLQKSNGKFYLCLWQEVPSYTSDNHDNKVEADIAVPPAPVTLTFATPIASAALYSPAQNTQAAPLALGQSQIALSVPDEVVIVELSPQKAAPRRAK